jgi:hypothetical protein
MCMSTFLTIYLMLFYSVFETSQMTSDVLRHKLKQGKGLAFLMLSTFHSQTKGLPQREVLVP